MMFWGGTFSQTYRWLRRRFIEAHEKQHGEIQLNESGKQAVFRKNPLDSPEKPC